MPVSQKFASDRARISTQPRLRASCLLGPAQTRKDIEAQLYGIPNSLWFDIRFSRRLRFIEERIWTDDGEPESQGIASRLLRPEVQYQITLQWPIENQNTDYSVYVCLLYIVHRSDSKQRS